MSRDGASRSLEGAECREEIFKVRMVRDEWRVVQGGERRNGGG